MDQKTDIINQTLELGENILDGLEHTLRVVKRGEYQETISLVGDIIEGFSSLEKSIPLVWNQDTSELTALTGELRNSFNLLVNAYEESNEIKILDALHDDVLPLYKKWFECIQDNLADTKI